MSESAPNEQPKRKRRRRRGGKGRSGGGAGSQANANASVEKTPDAAKADGGAKPKPQRSGGGRKASAEAGQPKKKQQPKPKKAAGKGPKRSAPSAPELGERLDVDPDEPVGVLFKDLGIDDAILANLNRMGFERPTPIQAHAIPPAIGGGDLIGCAQTGTGKTAAFAIPIIHRLLDRKGLGALVLAPTRELAQQIEETFKNLVVDTELRVALVYGGTPVRADEIKLRHGAEILIATPGRFLDLHERGLIWEDFIEVLVLDEADRMLDMGFEIQLNKILDMLPKDRQNLLFSATMPDKVVSLVKRASLTDPLQIQVGVTATPIELVEQRLMELTVRNKEQALLDVLDDEDGSVLVFVRTKIGTEKLFRALRRQRYKVARMHGGRSQEEREHALDDFKDGSVRILVATEVAARGLDISNVAHVVNFDMPDDPEEYVHRIGRTGRMGASGVATSFATPEEIRKLRSIEQLVGKKIERIGSHRWSEADIADGPRRKKRSHGPSRNKHRRR